MGQLWMQISWESGSVFNANQHGFIVLLNLGITLTGFHDDDIYQRAVTVFARGRWDGQLSDLKPFDLANF